MALALDMTAVREGAVLATIVGPRIGDVAVINELTTVAAAFSMAQFTDGTSIAGSAFGLRIATCANGGVSPRRTQASFAQPAIRAPERAVSAPGGEP